MKEVAASTSFLFENLREKKRSFSFDVHQMNITGLPMLINPVLLYSPSHAPMGFPKNPWASLAAPLRVTVRQQGGELT